MRTRFLLFLIRWHLASDNPLPPWLDRACASNPVLAAALDEEKRLTARLRDVPSPAVSATDPRLERRLLQSLRTAPSTQRRVYGRPSPALVAGGLLAAAALALAVIQTRKIPAIDVRPDQTAVAIAPIPTHEADPDFVTDLAVSLRPGDFGPAALEQEIEYVLADARGALRFLASNFVPSQFMPAEPGDSDGQG